jgi:hypothetical protein
MKGISMVSLGSSADQFYLKNGYAPREYRLKVHKDQLIESYKSIPNFSYVSICEEPIRGLYFKIIGNYDANIYRGLKEQLAASDSCTIFEKQL